MIVAPLASSLLIVTQGDHAHLASEVLSLVRIPELVEHPRRKELLRAVREHDNGWREVDAAPSVDPESGRPVGFREVGDGVRRRLWSRGCRRLRESSSYVALLITLHALELHAERRGDEGWDEWLDDLEELRDELLEEAEIEPAHAAADHDWLALADAMSLALCERSESRFERLGLTGTASQDRLELDPFPFAGATTFQLPCRRIARIRYRSDLDLGLALARSPWEKRPLRISPA